MNNDCIGESWWPVYITNTTQSCQVEGLKAVLLKIQIWVPWNVKPCQKTQTRTNILYSNLWICVSQRYIAVFESHCSITLLTLQTVKSTPYKEYCPVRCDITQSGRNLPTVWKKLLLSPSRNPLSCIRRQQVPQNVGKFLTDYTVSCIKRKHSLQSLPWKPLNPYRTAIF